MHASVRNITWNCQTPKTQANLHTFFRFDMLKQGAVPCRTAFQYNPSSVVTMLRCLGFTAISRAWYTTLALGM